MARKMVLVQEDLLSELWYLNSTGVPILHLKRQYELKVSHPTLAKLMGYMTAMESAVDEEVQSIIYSSLFPDWLTADETVRHASPPKGWSYVGTMPLGEWVNANEGETI